ncbi:metal ABC transporter ATP-binding protein [Liquorilactobacillus satsumensis]|uniref:ABC transporter ATP-binding protein n=1 Tax=Liquorilactobacillus satsumensis DSM 16230 = JCM 12392 TaxID=1423801 RepID=A0A0R1V0N2_9LACO|nr:ATP-binding cassette domain-containing protein [Liquorilactobacillus satsumensis]KRL99180.1 ABC transporter ATP-binding protein [Liquorilactobacillus satsumensis DSM 16230 = JCM 12392]MCP9312894.1 ATP-binding cassette domain-containing protein [Liquorilactobacillus satsumensis]MCP9329303.1 ATP-binding cassette domain-containing protein [Liquorilactobacillus satsumensis]MCP9359990.1 ATP-binding cassette domain-containing protein [Liquorilactobacillus satsumensis]
MKTIIEVKDLNLSVPEKQLFKQLSFSVPANKLTCMTGENGVGKTTLAKYLLRSFTKDDQHIKFAVKRTQVQYVPQLRNIDDEFPLSIHDFVALGLHRSHFLWHSRNERQLLKKVLAETQLANIQKEALGAASGGEKQRAFLAQALCAEPKLLILDEATASLDKDAKHKLLQLISKQVAEKDITVLFITHDNELIARYADYELILSAQQGKLIERERATDAAI